MFIYTVTLVLLLGTEALTGTDTDVCTTKLCKCRNDTKTVKGLVVDCSSAKIQNLNTVTFPPAALSLILDENPLASIPADSFKGVPDLSSLSLKALKGPAKAAYSLVNGTFNGLAKLKQLILTGTELQTIDQGVFADLPILDHLDLSSTGLSTVPDLAGNKKLSVLILAGNKLKDVQLSTCCAVLTRLVLSNNQLTALAEGSLPASPALVTLGLAENNISSISDKALTALDHLQSVDISGNPITNSVLKTLVKSLPSSLVSLKVGKLKLTQLDDGTFDSLDKLTNLDVSGNNLSQISAKTFAGLEVLQHLDLRNSSIAKLDASAFPMANLMTLELSMNLLQSVPAGLLDALGELQSLDLSAQKVALSDLPLSILSKSPKVSTLNLATNSLGSVIASDQNGTLLAGLTNLTNLHLEANQITKIPAAFFSGLAPRLKPQSEAGPPSHLNVYLQGNQLASWPTTLFTPLSKLGLLNLSSNGIALITNETINGLPKTAFQLDLDGNSWVCNCSLLWFRYWLEQAKTASQNITVPNWRKFVCGPNSTPPLPNAPFANFNNKSIPCGPQPAPMVSTIGFFYGVIAAIVAGLLFISLATLWLYRYEIFICLHLCRLRKRLQAAGVANAAINSSGRDSLIPTDLDIITRDVYVIVANDFTDQGWVRSALSSRLSSYVASDCHSIVTSGMCNFCSNRLSMIDAYQNVVIVVSKNLKANRQPLHLDIHYVLERANKLPQYYRPPIIIQHGSFCSCGRKQQLPRRLLDQMHCDACRLPLKHPQASSNYGLMPSHWTESVERLEGQVPSLLYWPESRSVTTEDDFWAGLKAALGPPILSDSSLRAFGDNTGSHNASVLRINSNDC